MINQPLLSCRFILRKNKARNGFAPIRLHFTINSLSSEISTKLKCPIDIWDLHSARAKGSSKSSNIINAQLDDFRIKFIQHYNLLCSGTQEVDIPLVKATFNKAIVKPSLILTLDEYIETIKAKNGKGGAKATAAKYSYLKDKLSGFLKNKYNVKEMEFAKCNHGFVSRFEVYLKSKHELGHNTAMKYIQMLKAIGSFAVKMNYIASNPFAMFKCSKEQVNREALTDLELETIISKEIQIVRLQEVRDLFVFCCYTGFAYADVSKLNRDNLQTGIDGRLWVMTERTKTKIP